MCLDYILGRTGAVCTAAWVMLLITYCSVSLDYVAGQFVPCSVLNLLMSAMRLEAPDWEFTHE